MALKMNIKDTNMSKFDMLTALDESGLDDIALKILDYFDYFHFIDWLKEHVSKVSFS